jgi:hypothetical protein
MTINVTPIPRLIDLAAPAFTLGTSNAAGSAATAVASDSTLLAFDTTLPAATGTAATGSATTAPRRDHVHAGTALAAPALTLGTANSAGSASTALATDSTILAFDTTVPAATGTAATGSATTAPRRDHVHASTVAATVVEMEAASSNTVFATPGRTQNHPGVAKVWLDHENTTTISASYNVDSVATSSTGLYVVTIGTDMSSTNYCVVANSTGAATDFRFVQVEYSMAVGSFQLDCSQADSLTEGNIMAAVFGDQ